MASLTGSTLPLACKPGINACTAAALPRTSHSFGCSWHYRAQTLVLSAALAGIGVCAALALLDLPQTEELPPLECLFTVDEETGLTGEGQRCLVCSVRCEELRSTCPLRISRRLQPSLQRCSAPASPTVHACAQPPDLIRCSSAVAGR